MRVLALEVAPRRIRVNAIKPAAEMCIRDRLNLKQFIADHVINRQISMFAADIEANKETLRREIENKSVCVLSLIHI